MAPTLTDRIRSELARRELLRREALDDFGAYCRLAIEAGQVPGCARVEWGWHLDAFCLHTQLQLEGWIVAYGPPRKSLTWPAWATKHARMIARQRALWEQEWPVEVGEGEEPRTERATWEDGRPEPWLRYVYVQNSLDNLPPGTMKSSLACVLANTWMWLHVPRCVFGAVSGVDVNVTRDSNATRDIVRGAWYRQLFQITWTTYDLDEKGEVVSRQPAAIKVRPDADAVSDWATSAGGRRYSRTWNRGISGLHVDFLLGDDPDDAERVSGEAARVGAQNKWTNAMETRVNDEHRSCRKIMQQVVHAEGMSAYLLSIARWSPRNIKGWARLCIPAEYGMGPAGEPERTPYGWKDPRTEPGQTMHPRLSPGVLADKKLKLPGYEGQFNQNPDRQGTGIFAASYARFFVLEGMSVPTRRRPLGCIQREEMPPRIVSLDELTRITLSIDAANSLKANTKPGAKVSAVGLGVAGCLDDDRFILDDRTRVLGADDTYLAVFEILAVWQIETIIVELKAMGVSVIAAIEGAIRRGWYIGADDRQVPLLGPDGNPVRAEVIGYNPGGEDKIQRAHGMLPDWKRGLYHFLDGADWLYPRADAQRRTVDDGMIGEVCKFPGARRNDRVDWLSQFSAHRRDDTDVGGDWGALGKLALVGSQRR